MTQSNSVQSTNWTLRLLMGWCVLMLITSTAPPVYAQQVQSGTAFTQERLYGRWTPESQKFVLAIVPTSEAGKPKDRIEAHTRNRVWKGWYETSLSNPIRAQLFYLPNADEINPEIPYWARKKLDGELEWRLELRVSGPDHQPFLQMRWYRGLVEWDETSKAVTIKGDGNPLEFDLHYDPILSISQYGTSHVEVYPAGAFDQDETPPPLGSVLQHQKFMVAVYLPEREADELGETINVSIKGLQSGGAQTLTLYSDEPKLGIVRYTHSRPVSLGRCRGRPQYQPPVMSMEWVGAFLSDGKSLGSCLPFSGISGEMVEFSYNKAAYRIQYFPSWSQATVARQRDKIERYRKIYGHILTSSAPVKAKEFARVKLRLIKNYDSLMELKVGGGELVDIHKAVIGEIYLGGAAGPTSYLKHTPYAQSVSPSKGLLFYTDKDLQIVRGKSYRAQLNSGSSTMWRDAVAFYGGEDAGRRAADASILAKNVVWQYCRGNPIFRPRPEQDEESQLKLMRAMNCFEQKAVYIAMRHVGTQALNDISKAFFTGLTYTLYEASAYVSPAGDIYTLFTAQDIYGKKVSDFEYWMTAAGLAVDGFSAVFAGSELYDMVAPKRNYRNTGGKIIRTAEELASGIPISRQSLARQGKPLSRFVTRTVESSGESIGKVFKNVAETDDLPSSLSNVQKRQLSRRFTPVGLDVSDADFPKTPPRMQIKFVAPKTNALGPKTSVLVLQNELLSDYGPDAGLSGFRGNDVFSPTVGKANAYADAVAGNYTIWRTTGKSMDETSGTLALKTVLADAVSEKPQLKARAAAMGITERMPESILNRRLQLSGIEVTKIDPTRSQAISPLDIKLALDQGWVVETRLEFNGKIRSFIVEDILVDPSGVPVKVRGFDPKYGAIIDVDATVFNKKIVRDGKTVNFKLARATDPDKVVKRLPLGFSQKPARFLPWDSKVTRSTTDSANVVFEYVTADGNKQAIRLGDKLAEGRTNTLYHLPEFPDQLVRITKSGATENEIASDLFGRNALMNASLDHTYIEAPKQRGVYRLKDGRVVEIIDVVKGTEARTLLKKQPGKVFSRGQGLALEAATRELNKAGYVWTDGHPANFSFEKRPGQDKWRVHVFDPGGIFPAIGDTKQQRALNARKMQKLIQVPDDFAIKRFKTNEDLAIDIIRSDFQEQYARLIDYEKLKADPSKGLPVTPRVGLSQPIVRELFDLSDAQLKAQLK
jgi:hypothetical protein